MTPDTDPLTPPRERDEPEQTTAGNYFVANYPPFSFWSKEEVAAAHDVLAAPPAADVPFGLYVHIPFCRRRCDFCYFRVYTGGEARSVETYIDALIEELHVYTSRPRIAGRQPLFVYFGGGTPSFLSPDQLRRLFTGLQRHLPWDAAREVTFECEPGTLDEEKIAVLRDLGVTRLSLGVENFDAGILELNNRAHRAREIHAAWSAVTKAGFPQVNIDLIAGMVGETEENWSDCIRQARAMAPESMTLYQMEIPYNTTVYQRMKDGGERVAPVADWPTKRRWVDEGFRALEEDGYRVGSAYTAVREDDSGFLYRDGLWHGADMLGLGVASFSHLGGIHFQNEHDLEPFGAVVRSGKLPIHRALALTDEERLVREFILQLKLGVLDAAYFEEKFGVDVIDRFRPALAAHENDGFLRVRDGRITLSRQGLLQVDRLLHAFFLEEHRGARYA